MHARLEPLLARANLLITRDIEWANIMLAFEQENRYVIVDPCYPQAPVGSIREQSNVIFRQLLRSRRPFVARITDAMGNEIFRVRRPFWLINSTIYAEVNGKEVGVVHRRWHLWRRIYDLYLGNKQFALVENPGFWNWTFTLRDEEDRVLAQIDRDWRGLGLEIIGHSYIPPFHRYEIPQPRWFSEKAQGGPEKHQPDKVHPQLDDSTKKNDTSKMPDQLYGEGGKHSQIISFSPLETRISGLRSESSKIKWIERSQKLTYALIPALLIVSKTKLTTSLLILSVYWQIYGFFKEIFLDYVHQEVTLKWLLVYFRLLLLILAKDTFLYFNLV